MFEPWLGRHWNSPSNYFQGRRILILGESHYCSAEEPWLIGKSLPSATVEVVEKWAIGNRHRFFTGVTQVITGRKRWELSSEEIREIWDSVAFFNYIPVFVASGPRTRPTPDMFSQGAGPFTDFVETERPDLIIVCGYTLWWHVLMNLRNPPSSEPHTIPSYKIGPSIAMRMKHPSAGFSSDHWRKIFAQYLKALPASHDD